LDPFDETALTFISATFKSGWDQLNIADKTSFQKRINDQFSRLKLPHPRQTNTKQNPISKVLPPILAQLSKEQLESAKRH